jgi:hypothetical protein
MKKRRAGATVRLGNFNAHDAKVEQPRDESRRDLCVLVHLADERTDLAVRELVDAVPEQRLVLAELRQRYRKAVSLLHASKKVTGIRYRVSG